MNLRLQPRNIDLIVDYRIISEFNPPFARLCSRLPLLEQWRTFTVGERSVFEGFGRLRKEPTTYS